MAGRHMRAGLCSEWDRCKEFLTTRPGCQTIVLMATVLLAAVFLSALLLELPSREGCAEGGTEGASDGSTAPEGDSRARQGC